MKLEFKEEALTILKCLNDHGFEAYIVGGAVRNKLLNIKISDYDITTSATPDEMINIFTFAKIVPTGLKHGTITVFYNHIPFEVTTFRIDGDYTDNRHPDDVKFVTNLELDLSRRDFTINAMCYNNELIDLFGGIDDLKKKIIRTVNDPIKRFDEDALRILRALRFACQLKFSIELETKRAIHSEKYLLKNISAERVVIELFNMFKYDNTYVLREFFDVFLIVFPTLNVSQKEEVIRKFKYFNSIKDEKQLLKFAFLVKDLKNDVSLYDLYKLSKKQIRLIRLVSEDLKLNDNIIECKKLLKNYDFDDIIFYTNYHIENEEEKGKIKEALLKASLECHRINMLAIRGQDLFDLNIKSKYYSKVLNHVLDLVIEEKMPNDHDLIIKYLKNLKCL